MSQSSQRSPLLPIFLIVAVDILGLTIILPLLPFYAEHFGASPRMVGLLTATYAFFQLFSGPILGQLSDRSGRKPLLIVSQIGTFIGFILMARAQTLAMVFVARAIDGATAGNLSLAQAYITDVTRPEERAKSFAVIGIAFGLGFLIGPAISGFLSQYGYTYPIYAAAALSATSILATSVLLPRVIPHAGEEAAGPGGKRLGVLQWKTYMQFFERPEMGRLLVQFFLFCLAFSLFTSGFGLFAERRFIHDGHPYGTKEVGYLFAYSGFLGIFFQGGMIGRLVKRFGEHAMVYAGFIGAAFGYFFLGLSHHLALLLVVATVCSFGNGTLRPVLTSLISQQAGKKEHGVVLGLNQSLNSIAQIIAPILAGMLINQAHLTSWAWLAASISIVGIFLAHRKRRTRVVYA